MSKDVSEIEREDSEYIDQKLFERMKICQKSKWKKCIVYFWQK